MKVAVIYQSQYGSTETYARWLAEALHADLLLAKNVKTSDLLLYETIVYGGGIYVGSVKGIELLAKNSDILKNKNLYLFAVGASDMKNPENVGNIQSNLEKKLPKVIYEKMQIFYLRGGLHYSNLTFFHRMMMGVVIKTLRKKPKNELRSDEKEILESVNRDADFTDQRSILPLVEAIQAGGKI